MRHIELLLKLSFIAAAANMYIVSDIMSPWYKVFLVVSILLGIVLIFNKKASYNFTQKPRDIILRRIEGGVLILAAVVGLAVVFM